MARLLYRVQLGFADEDTFELDGTRSGIERRSCSNGGRRFTGNKLIKGCGFALLQEIGLLTNCLLQIMRLLLSRGSFVAVFGCIIGRLGLVVARCSADFVLTGGYFYRLGATHDLFIELQILRTLRLFLLLPTNDCLTETSRGRL